VAAAAAAAARVGERLGHERVVIYSPDVEAVVAAEQGSELGSGRAQLSTVLTLAEVLELREQRFSSHAMLVARLCEAIGRELGLGEQRVNRLRLAGLLHDIGKVGLPDAVLNKAGALNPQERAQVQRCPEMAGRILGAKEMADIREWIMARHERLDGNGYPLGLAGEQIPLEARILAVAESYDAMRSERPYRAPLSRAAAIAELELEAGTQFDGHVVAALLQVLEEEPAQVRGA
jgi:HD-GYP domain-containing protein (c-di-GMP phosphodiesterase class II)